LVSINVAKLVDKPQVQDNPDDIRFLSLEELEALLRAIPDDDLGGLERVMYRAAAMLGIRQGEVRGLRWADIDWTAFRVRIRQNYVMDEFGTPKSRGSSRSVPLAPLLAAELENHFTVTPWKKDNDLVFCHPHTGKPYDRSKLLKRFKKALRTAKVNEVTFHELRHTFGTTCAANGIPIRTIMEWMGHQDIKTTQVYAHYSPSEMEGKWIEDAFTPRTPSGLQGGIESDQLEAARQD
jgi:integrase